MGKSVSSLLQVVVKTFKSYFKRKSDESRVVNPAVPPPADSLQFHHNQSNIDTPSFYLPVEIIELILSKCPVKSIIRFKSVSKPWQSIISSPRFSIIYRFHWSKVPENQNKFMLLAHGMLLSARIYLIRWEEDGIMRIESMLPYPSQIFNIPLCYCNGLILLGQTGNNRQFLLCNPSIRKHIMISGPHNGPRPPSTSHFYYDSITDDYMIVFVYENCYTVYSCKKRRWSEMKGLPCDLSLTYCHRAYVDGCFYGLVGNGEIVCFDTRDGNMHKFRQPNDVKNDVELREVSGSLYFFCNLKDDKELEMWAMEKHGSFEKWVMKKNNSLMEWFSGWTWMTLINMEDEEVADLRLKNNARLLIIREEVTDDPRNFETKYDFASKSRIFPHSENLYMPYSNI